MDVSAFKSFEHAGWEQAAEPYAECWGELTSQTIGPLLEAAMVGESTRVLDVATGPGWLAAAAASRGANVVGVDFSIAMVREARRRHPQVRFQVGDAEALPFTDSSVDAVVMNFGMLHLARPEQAVQEALRVLRSGGRFGFTVWAPPAEAVVFGMTLGSVEMYGDAKVAMPPGPPFFRFSDAAECKQVLSRAGFVEPSVRRVPQTWRVESPETVFNAMYRGTVRTGGLLRRQTEESLARIRRAIESAASTYRVDDHLELPMPAVLACGRKP